MSQQVPSWDDVLANHLKVYAQHLGAEDPVMRCQARFGMAVQQPLNAWYADEMERRNNPGVAMSAAAIAFGQILGTMVINAGGDAAQRDVAMATLLRILESELRSRVSEILAGQCEDMKGVRR